VVVTPFDGRLDRIRRRRASLASVIERLALCPDAGSGVALIALRADASAATDAAAARQRPLEAAAVADVHDRRGRELFGLCRRLGLDDDEANDAVQEAFLRMWAESERGTVIVDPEAWAFRVTYRLAMDHHRFDRLVRSLADRLSVVGARDELDPTDRLAVWAAVDRLPPRQRAVIYLRYRADLTYERIARVMGITANGARNDASAATATLRKRYLSEEGLR
jgi:RNA polymerase sigma factor (sigma-70 family)